MTFAFSNPYINVTSLGTTVDLRFSGGGAFASPTYNMDGIKDASGNASNEAVSFWYGNAGTCFATGQAANGYVEPVAISYGKNYVDANNSKINADKTTIHFNGIALPRQCPSRRAVAARWLAWGEPEEPIFALPRVVDQLEPAVPDVFLQVECRRHVGYQSQPCASGLRSRVRQHSDVDPSRIRKRRSSFGRLHGDLALGFRSAAYD